MAAKRKWESFKKKMSNKRVHKAETVDDEEYLTVQRLTPTVKRKAQKYTRIGALTMVGMNKKERTLENAKESCMDHFKIDKNLYECDILAGERGPSFSTIGQVKNWKLLHIRLVERGTTESTQSQAKCHTCVRDRQQPGLPVNSHFPQSSIMKSTSENMTSKAQSELLAPSSASIAKSVPCSQMIQLGKLIPPSREIATMQMEEFDVQTRSWREPFEATISLEIKKFATGGCRDAYKATALKGLHGNLVVKQYREDQIEALDSLFTSVENHTRKTVQMHTLAHHFAALLHSELPVGYGRSFKYTKLYFSKIKDDYVTVEQYIEGQFTKYVNNTGDIINHGNEVGLKAEAFAHYSFVKSGKQLMVLDLQGVYFQLCDPEIASTELYADDLSIYFCAGNLSGKAIETFFAQHQCNKFCELLRLGNK